MIFKVQFLLIITLFMTTLSMAQNTPIIDREVFFGNPEISGGQLSPDGKFLTFIKPYHDVRNIWIKGVDEPFEKARPITADTTRPIPGYFWSRDSKYILYVQDDAGDENYNLYAVNPYSMKFNSNGVPDAKGITQDKGVRVQIQHLSHSDADIIYLGINDRDPSWHDLYKVHISTGERELVYKNEDRISGFDFDHNDKARLAARVMADGGTELLKYQNGKFEPFYTCPFGETCYVNDFHKDNNQVYLVTNKGDRDLTELILYNLSTGEEELLERDPKGEVDFAGMFLSDLTHDILLTAYVGDKRRLYFKDKSLEDDYNWLKTQLKDVEISLSNSTKDERKFLITADSDVDPGATYLFDRDKRKLTFQYRPRPELPVDQLATMKPIRYKSYDGLEIPAYLTLPKGEENAKNLPAVMFIHGGPWARDYWGYHSYAQFLANRGYAVLQPNFRSSTGFGKKFLNAGNGEWGEKMQDDISAGVDYLVKNGIADKDNIAIMGGSYGGYATLAGMTFTPDLYAAGVSIVGPSNLLTLLESIPPYWEAGRIIMYKRMANPETEEGLAKLKAQSPLFSVDNIKNPLMVVQGANDPRVKQAESDQIVVAMREAHLPVQYLVAKDEGHGFRNPDNQIAFIAEVEKFLAEHIGGRYQKDVNEEIQAKINELTVDISTVELPKKLDDNLKMVDLPAIAYDVQSQNLRYSFSISMGGQEMKMVVKQSINNQADALEVTTNVESPMLNMNEKLYLNPQLEPMMKKVDQGPLSMDYKFYGDRVDCEILQGEKTSKTSCKLNANVWDENTGLNLAIAHMQLDKGMEYFTRVYDSQKNKVQVMKITVGESEKIEVPAGKFDCKKVIVDNPEDSNPKTLYVYQSKKGNVIVKSLSTIKEMGGANASMELVEM